MKNIIIATLLLIGLISCVSASWTPPGDINLRDTYSITNGINATFQWFKGNLNWSYIQNPLFSDFDYAILSKWENITGHPTGLNNFTNNIGIGNWSNDQSGYVPDGALASVGNWTSDKSSYYTSTIIDSLGNFSAWGKGYGDIVGTPTVLSNFTDDLGDRGYDNNLNFTNGADYWNDTSATFNKSYADTLYATTGAGNSSWNESHANTLYYKQAIVDSLGNWTTDKGDYSTTTYIQSLISSIGNWTSDKGSYYVSTVIDSLGNFSDWDKSYNDIIGTPTDLSNFTNNIGIGNWSEDQVDYYNKSEVNTNITNANNSASAYADNQDTIFNNSIESYVNDLNVSMGTWVDTFFARFTELVSYVGNYSEWNHTYSSLVGTPTVLSNFSNDVNYFNLTTQLDNRILSNYDNLTGEPTSNLNFTNDANYYNSTTPQTETDPLWTANQSNYVKTGVLSSIGNWTNDKASYYVSTIIDSLGNFSNWDKSYDDIIGTPGVLSNFTDDLGDRGYTSNSNFSNDEGYLQTAVESISSADDYIFLNDSTNSVEIDFNESKLEVDYFLASAIQVVTGSGSGNLTDIQTYDRINYNVTESNSDYELIVNFTGITEFTSLLIRHKSNVDANHLAAIQIWDYGDSDWEGYGYLTEGTIATMKTIGVYDYADHIDGGVVQVRIYQVEGPPNTAHIQQFDWVGLSKGFGTPVGQEIDPYWSSEKENYWNNTELLNGTLALNSSLDNYRLDSWDNFTGIPVVTPTDGNDTHLSTADQIYDWVIGLGYTTTSYVSSVVGSVGNWSADKSGYVPDGALASVGNWTSDKSSYYTTSIIDSLGNFSDWDKSYDDIIGTPTVLTNFTNDANYITNITMNKTNDWNSLSNYPVACPTYSAITQLNDSVTCTDSWVNIDGDNMTGDLNVGDNNFSVGTSDFFVDNNNGNVGIGTATPGAKLQIGTNLNSVSDADMFIGGHRLGTTPIYRIRTGSFDDNADYGFYLKTDYSGGTIATMGTRHNTDTDTLTLKEGNVGIGTTSPISSFVINSDNFGVPSSVNFIAKFVGPVDTLAFAQAENAGNKLYIQALSNSDFSDRRDLLLNPYGGNVGIGVTDPHSKLEVNGSLNISGTGAKLIFPDGTTLSSNASLGSGSVNDYTLLSKWENITGRPIVLSNFTDDLGDRGYDNNLNFTNGANYWNDTSATFNKTYADTLYATTGAGNSSWNETYAKTIPELTTTYNSTYDLNVGDNSTWNESYADTLYYKQSIVDSLGNFSDWDKITDIPHATPSDGDTTHLSLADEIYDWVIGLGYTTTAYVGSVVSSVGNWTADKGDYSTTVGMNTAIVSANTSLKSYADTTFLTGATNLTEDEVEAYIFDSDNTANLNMSSYNVTSVDCIVFSSGGKICSGS